MADVKDAAGTDQPRERQLDEAEGARKETPMTDPQPLDQVIAPPQHVIDFAVEQSTCSPCQSKRGVVIFWGIEIISHGYNFKPRGFDCDGSDACKANCRREAVHAEQMALLAAGSRAHASQLIHVKSVDGKLVPSGGPSCVECSKLIRAAGLAWVWLYHEDGWKRYTSEEFHRLSLASAAVGPSGTSTQSKASAASTTARTEHRAASTTTSPDAVSNRVVPSGEDSGQVASSAPSPSRTPPTQRLIEAAQAAISFLDCIEWTTTSTEHDAANLQHELEEAVDSALRAQPTPPKLINTKGDVEAACRAEQHVDGDHLDYALHHIKAAIAKREDAPCSSAEHAKDAEVALRLERKPTYREIVRAWQMADPLCAEENVQPTPSAAPETPQVNEGARRLAEICEHGAQSAAPETQRPPTLDVGQIDLYHRVMDAIRSTPWCKDETSRNHGGCLSHVHKLAVEENVMRAAGMPRNCPKCKGKGYVEQPLRNSKECSFCHQTGTAPGTPALTAGFGSSVTEVEPTCEHGTALDVHCCNCHSGFIFDKDHKCPAAPPSAGVTPPNLEQVARVIAAAVAQRVKDGDPCRPIENIVYHEVLRSGGVTPRVLELAVIYRASHRQPDEIVDGHSRDFETCPNSDCVAMRESVPSVHAAPLNSQVGLTGDCVQEGHVSRICERSTAGCDVRHRVPSVPAERPTKE